MQPDLFTAMADRDAALRRVTENAEPWTDQAKRAMRVMLAISWIGTGEDIRTIVSSAIGNPHHHNAWGGLIGWAVKAKLVEPTGEYRPMKGASSHARKTPVYRRLADV